MTMKPRRTPRELVIEHWVRLCMDLLFTVFLGWVLKATPTEGLIVFLLFRLIARVTATDERLKKLRPDLFQ